MSISIVKKFATAGLVAAGLALAGCGSSDNTESAAADAPNGAEAISFNYGLVTADQYALYVAQDLGLFEKHGLAPKFTQFQSGALLLSALKSKSIDVAAIGMGAVFALGQDTPLKIIAWDVNSSLAAGFVSKDSGLRSYSDVTKAGKIGVATGSCAQVALYYLAKAAGTPYSDLDVANIPPAQAVNALRGGGIQSAVLWAPFIFQANDAGIKTVAYTTEWPPEGGFCPSFTAVRGDYLSANAEVGKRLIDVQADALAAIEKDPSIAIKALMDRLNVSKSVATRMFERVWKDHPTYAQQLDPSSPYSLASSNGLAAILTRGAEAFADLKVIPKPIDPKVIDEAVDASYLEAHEEAAR